MKAEYIDHMGDDLMVVNSARVSFDKESELEPEALCPTDEHGGKIPPYRRLAEKDKKLISYLAKHNHWTPFAHPQITLRMGAPVPIRTQCFKHKTGFVENEESRRYISSKPSFFIPTNFRKACDNKKQGSGGSMGDQAMWQRLFQEKYEQDLWAYEHALHKGLCEEQARFLLPQGTEVHWYWTGSLSAYARFYNLRVDPHAQEETKDLAKEVGDIIAPLYPESWEALTK